MRAGEECVFVDKRGNGENERGNGTGKYGRESKVETGLGEAGDG